MNKILIAALLISCVESVAASDLDIFRVSSDQEKAIKLLLLIDNSTNWEAELNGTSQRAIVHEGLYKFFDSLESRLSGSGNPSLEIGVMGLSDVGRTAGGEPWLSFMPLSNSAERAAAVAALKQRLFCLSGELSPREKAQCDAQLLLPWPNDSDRATVYFIDPVSGNETQADFDLTLFQRSMSLPAAAITPTTLALHEANLWFQGDSARAGQLNAQFDGSRAEGYAGDAFVGAQYRKPSGDGSCPLHLVTLINSGAPGVAENNSAEQLLLSESGRRNPSYPFQLPINSSQANWLDEYAHFLANRDFDADQAGRQNIATRVIDLFDKRNDRGELYDPGNASLDYRDYSGLSRSEAGVRQLLYSAGRRGTGGYWPVGSVEGLLEQLSASLTAVLERNSVFAGLALPISVNARGTNENQVYMGLFRPDNQQRWRGNLKLYQIGLSGDNRPRLEDADGNVAEDLISGFVYPQARSFWTRNTSFNYWRELPETSEGDYQESESPDGREVERGGVAQALREFQPTRRQLTCNSSCNGLVPLDTTAVSQQQLNLSDTTQRDQLLEWLSGQDTEDLHNRSSRRPYLHGDVVHSQPVAINYGDKGIYLFYGANDGLFRAVRGGSDEGVGSDNGWEVWSFVAPEQFDALGKLYANNAAVDAQGFAPKAFFFDGGVGRYVEYAADENGQQQLVKAYIYLTARRGGRYIYAIDVTDPLEPALMWRRSASDGLSELGQSWSKPVIVDAAGQTQPVLFMGLGYDPAVDDQRDTTATHTMGRGIIALDAITGETLWQASNHAGDAPVSFIDSRLQYSVPSELAVIDRNSDGTADRIYFGDTGGQLWRVDIGNALRSEWRATVMLDVGRESKFLFAPDVSIGPDGAYDALLIGSGDREDPLDSGNQDALYLVRDYRQLGTIDANAAALTPSDLLTLATNSDGSQILTVPSELTTADAVRYARGWRFMLEPGEKTVSRVLTSNGLSTFATNLPSSTDSCNALGEARVYLFDPFTLEGQSNAQRNWSSVPGGGLLPPPVGFTVVLGDKTVSGVMFGVHAEQATSKPLATRKKLWWRSNRGRE
ncbi:MAG: pilus assembly protein [Porticoccaceae bacterium]